MRIAIDARPASHRQPGGFKSYTKELLHALARVDKTNEYLIYFDRLVPHALLDAAENFSCKILPIRVPLLGVVWREQIEVAHQAKQDCADLVHFPANTAAWRLPCPTVVTMHDTIFWDEQPELQGLALSKQVKRRGMFWYGRWAALAGVRNARRLITVSEYSKREIKRQFGVPPERCSVIHNGVSEQFQPIQDRNVLCSVSEKFGLRKPFLLGVTSASPRKNAEGLLAAYRALPAEFRQSHDLVLIWTHGLWKAQLADLIRDTGLEANVKFVEEASSRELTALMNLAALFVFPSLEEGFGMPPLEAMACGTPVVASNRASMPEILGDAARLVDPTNAHAVAQAITEILTDPALARSYIERGRGWAQRYSWDRCARETIAVYADASKSKSTV